MLVATISNLNAQLKIVADGSTYVKGFISADDYNDEVSFQVYGKVGTYLAGGRLSFGDYGSMSNGGGNAFIGEYGSYDSDMLQLHGKDGIYLTKQNGATIAYYTSSVNRFHFMCDVYSNGLKLTSDERFKTNINKLDSALESLKKLDGVSFYYDFSKTLRKNNTIYANDSGSRMSAKEKEYMAYLEQLEKKEELNKTRKLGFIAQDLQKVFPELVEKDSAGYLYVDYIGLIPVIVEALKEQQQQIDDLKKYIATKKSGSTLKSTSMSVTESLQTDNSLEQNIPNPFSTDTRINLSLSRNVKSAMLCIFDMQGTLIKSNQIFERGNTQINIAASELKPGMYFYTLIADGKEVDTKRMILTE